MSIVNLDVGSTIDEIAPDIYRISIPVNVPAVPGGFSFNQYLVVDEAPMLYHTGLRKLAPLVREAIARVMPVSRLAYVGFSHFEADECGSLNEFLALAPNAKPLCSRIAAVVSVDDVADRPAHALDDGAALSLGHHKLRSLYTPHLPHGWECNALFDETTGTLFCGDLFTQPGSSHAALTSGDILEPSELMRGGLDYFAHAPDTVAQLERLAKLAPTTLACMHGSAFAGDGAALLRELGRRVSADAERLELPRGAATVA